MSVRAIISIRQRLLRTIGSVNGGCAHQAFRKRCGFWPWLQADSLRQVAARGGKPFTGSPPLRELVVRSQPDEIQRRTKIVESLTLLVRADTGQKVSAKDPLRFDQLVLEGSADAEILGQRIVKAHDGDIEITPQAEQLTPVSAHLPVPMA